MIASSKYNLTFIFTPRTGSTSIESAILRGDPEARNAHPDYPPFRHQSYQEAVESPYPVYAVLREPTDWITSLYGRHRNPKSAIRPQLPILNNESDVLGVRDLLELHTFLNKWYVQPNLCTNQMDWIGDSNIIRFEDIETFCASRKIPKLPHLNAASTKPLSLTNDAQMLARLIWKADYEAYYT